MAGREPQHLEIFDKKVPWYRWDWRKENPGEVILVVFGLLLFVFWPRTGCGVTPEAQVSASADTPAVERAADLAEGKPQG
jgi:hypothetical protein